MTKTIRLHRLRGRIDFAVITIREDEFEAVLRRFPSRLPVIGGGHGYEYCRLKRPDGRTVAVAVARSLDQGQTYAQLTAHKVIGDLNPRWLVLIGIAGGVPDVDFSLGDVLLANSIHDLSVIAAIEGGQPELRPTGGSPHPDVAHLLAQLPAWRSRLTNWNSPNAVGIPKPTLDVTGDLNAPCYYGSPRHKKLVQQSLQKHFPSSDSARRPLFCTGAVATSNVLMKDTELLDVWKQAVRQITHIEMEAGGIYVAAKHNSTGEVPLVSIRGISDIIGFKRSAEWTQYACETASSFFFAMISELPLEQFRSSAGKRPSIFSSLYAALPATVMRVVDAGRDGYRLALDAIRVIRARETLRAPTVESILDAFRESSMPLLRCVVPPDERLPRPELAKMERMLSAQVDESILCVLGGTGTGKTALLALFAQEARNVGIATLAIKADFVPSHVPFDSWSQSELGLGIPALDAVRAVAAREHVLVIVDQLDALSSTVDLTSDRLDAVIAFIEACSQIGGVRVVCSCRNFDFAHDARFGALHADVVQLQLPEWQDVHEHLVKHDVLNSDQLHPDFKELLRNPQYLKVYLNRYAATGNAEPFRSYHLLLDDLWVRTVTKDAERIALYRLTEYLIDREELWAPLVKFDSHRQAFISLVDKGILQFEDSKVGFRHQTLLEHSKARLFTKDERSLAEHVLKHQDAIVVRPTVWAVLQYQRDANPTKYKSELRALFASDLRLHMRYLLIEFLGQVANPREFEIGIMGERLADDEDRVRTLISIRGNVRWFRAFTDSHFPVVMSGPVNKQWPMIGVIGDAWKHDRDTCLDLIEKQWLVDRAKDALSQRAMAALEQWDERAKDIILTLISRAEGEGERLWWAESLVYQISADQPALAPEVFVTTVRRVDTNRIQQGETRGTP